MSLGPASGDPGTVPPWPGSDPKKAGGHTAPDSPRWCSMSLPSWVSKVVETSAEEFSEKGRSWPCGGALLDQNPVAHRVLSHAWPNS